MTLAAILVAIPAARADELSDLVAAVVASAQKEQIAHDAAPNRLDVGKPRYRPSSMLQSVDINAYMLDGIISSMKRENFRQMRIDIFGDDLGEKASQSPYFSLQGYISHSTSFFRPVPGPVTSRFGWRPVFHREHHGIDLALQIGDTVRCAVSGTVEHIAYDHDGYGHYVMLLHKDGMETIYGHLQYPLVAQGQFIYAGQPIGIGGNTGNSTGPHLHFEARLGGIAVDPLLLFDFYGNNQYRIATDATTPPLDTPKTPSYSHQQKSLKHEETYIVRVGDTLESVARQAGISVMRLRQLNMLNEGENLPLGRMLKLK